MIDTLTKERAQELDLISVGNHMLAKGIQQTSGNLKKLPATTISAIYPTRASIPLRPLPLFFTGFFP